MQKIEFLTVSGISMLMGAIIGMLLLLYQPFMVDYFDKKTACGKGCIVEFKKP